MRTLACLILTACTGGGSHDTGELAAFSSDSGGFGLCGNSQFCGYDGTLVDGTIDLVSRAAPADHSGMLTPDGFDQLDAIIARIPSNAEVSNEVACGDVPTQMVTIDYAAAGAKTFTYACDPGGALSQLDQFLVSVRQSLITCQAGQLINIVSCQ